jgi:ankyrin repeat protein
LSSLVSSSSPTSCNKLNNLPEIGRLLRAGADVNVKDSRDRTPLLWASIFGHAQVVKELLDHGADIEATSISGRTSLHCAWANGNVAVVNELLSPNDSNDTTTILGKRKSQTGANAQSKNMDGDTPLYLASLLGHLAIVKALRAVGADILAVNDYGDMPIHLAVRFGYSEVANYLLLEFYATISRLPLHELLKDLTWIGDPNSSDVPPLHDALRRNVMSTNDVVEILDFLVRQNSELLRSCDLDGSVALHLACRRGASFTIIQSLVDLYKASVKILTPGGDLPLFLACEIPEPSLDAIFL